MTQVSDPTASSKEAIGSLRTKDAGQNQRAETQEPENEAEKVGQKGDKVQISQEAQERDGESRVQSGEAGENSDLIEKQAADRKKPQVQLREFQTRDEIRIEPKIVTDSVEEIKGQREKAEAAREPALETPSQRIIQEDNGSESARSSGNNVRDEQEGSGQQSRNPVSAQTETGQNVDDLI